MSKKLNDSRGNPVAGTHVHTATLSNGVRLVSMPSPDDDVTALTLLLSVGFRDEQPGQAGFAHLVEHILCQDGGAPPLGHLSFGRTMEDTTVIQKLFFPGQLNSAIATMAEKVTGETVDSTTISIQSAIVNDELRILRKQDTGRLVAERAAEAMLAQSCSYSYAPYSNVDSRVDSYRVSLFRTSNYSPHRVCVVASGRVDTERFFSAAAPRFGIAKREQQGSSNQVIVPSPAAPLTRVEERSGNSTVASISLLTPGAGKLRTLARLLVLTQIYADTSLTSTPALEYAEARLARFGPSLALRSPRTFTVSSPFLYEGSVGGNQIADSLLAPLREVASGGVTPQTIRAMGLECARKAEHALEDKLREAPTVVGAAILAHGSSQSAFTLPEMLAGISPRSVAAAAAELLRERRTLAVLVRSGVSRASDT